MVQIHLCPLRNQGPIAQLEEQQSYTLRVGGSSPSGPTMIRIRYSTTPEQQAYYAPLAWEIMQREDFHGMSYEHLLVEYENLKRKPDDPGHSKPEDS